MNPSNSGVMITVVTAAFNEEKNLPLLYERLSAVLETCGKSWEWVVVDDRSSDETFRVIRELAMRDRRVRGFRLSRNFGSHKAFLCGAGQAKGQICICLAGDLQDPPEIIPDLLEKHAGGSRVVWGVRKAREGESLSRIGFARLYYFLMRRLAGLKDMPASGADCFLLDGIVLRELLDCPERNTSVLALLTWMGYTRDYVSYEKKERAHGRSGWTLAKKLRLVTDSITGFSDFPLRLLFVLGTGLLVTGLACWFFLMLKGTAGGRLSALVSALAGVQLMGMGILGEYLWRNLEEARRRPRALIESSTESGDPRPS